MIHDQAAFEGLQGDFETDLKAALHNAVSAVGIAEGSMTTKVAQMTIGEVREMIETSVEQKLLELLGDPSLPLRFTFHA